MPDRVLFIPELAVPPQMVDDLLALSEVPDDAIEAVAAALEAAEGFLGGERIENFLNEILREDRLASAVASALENLRPEKLESVIQVLRRWRETNQQNADRLPQEAMAAIEEKLPRLVRHYPAFERYHKARRLASLTGNTAESIEVICDARPVFDAPRETIEGLVPLITLRIGYVSQDGEDRAMEVLLSQELLSELAEKAEKAKKKVKVLSESVEEWIPNGLVEFS